MAARWARGGRLRPRWSAAPARCAGFTWNAASCGGRNKPPRGRNGFTGNGGREGGQDEAADEPNAGDDSRETRQDLPRSAEYSAEPQDSRLPKQDFFWLSVLS